MRSVSARHVWTGGSLGVGGVAASHGPLWIVAAAVGTILLASLAAAEAGGVPRLAGAWRRLRDR